jgi:hypothetical protein
MASYSCDGTDFFESKIVVHTHISFLKNVKKNFFCGHINWNLITTLENLALNSVSIESNLAEFQQSTKGAAKRLYSASDTIIINLSVICDQNDSLLFFHFFPF